MRWSAGELHHVANDRRRVLDPQRPVWIRRDSEPKVRASKYRGARNYIWCTGRGHHNNTSDILEEYYLYFVWFQYFKLQDKPMGAVSVFMVGNYLNQPSEMTSALRDVVASPVFFEWVCDHWFWLIYSLFYLTSRFQLGLMWRQCCYW